ncbi:MAG: class I SAM-dependent methyltransferase [Rhodovibrionaceae bacterium]
MGEITNPVYAELVALGAVDPKGVKKIRDRTRDLPVPVYRDETFQVIFLESCETSKSYYEAGKQEDRQDSQALTYFADGSVIMTDSLEDAERRCTQFADRIAGRTICDFGCAQGSFLERAAKAAGEAYGVELRDNCLARIAAEQPEVRTAKDIRDFGISFDLVTLFHVLEHIPAQVALLERIRAALKPGGEIVVEVPHARDILIKVLEFRDFTFWSEHLVLHTRESLQAVIAAAGFEEIAIEGFQRYGYTNHLCWFVEGKPGGHVTYKGYEDAALDAAYRDYLLRRDATDTLIATARNPAE